MLGEAVRFLGFDRTLLNQDFAFWLVHAVSKVFAVVGVAFSDEERSQSVVEIDLIPLVPPVVQDAVVINGLAQKVGNIDVIVDVDDLLKEFRVSG